jgi:hypothetical protein
MADLLMSDRHPEVVTLSERSESKGVAEGSDRVFKQILRLASLVQDDDQAFLFILRQ